jgi:hypothetical protein
MPEKQLRLLDPPTRFCSRPGARRSVKRKIARSRRPQQFSETWTLLRSSTTKEDVPILLNCFWVRSDTNHGRRSGPIQTLLGRIARICALIPDTLQHRQPRVLRKARIRRGSLAHVKEGATIRLDPPHESAVGTKSDRSHELVSIFSTHHLRIQGLN